jgi:hypothetical protein
MRRLFALLVLAVLTSPLVASEGEKPVERDYALIRASPHRARRRSSKRRRKAPAVSHATPAPTRGRCTGPKPSCSGARIATAATHPLAAIRRWRMNDPRYVAARDRAHVLPRYPESWHWPSSANPKHSYTLLNREEPGVRPLHQSIRLSRGAGGVW